MNTSEVTKSIKKPSKATLRKWAGMTDRNEHEECLIAVSKYFFKETKDDWFARLAKAFKYILDEHIKIGHLTEELDTLRYCAMKRLDFEITYWLPRDCKAVFECM